MGTKFVFTCGSCGYSADISGAPDRGFFAATQTVSCQECRELYDVVVDEWSSGGEPGANRVEPKCPESAKHKVELWVGPGPCPSCGALMQKSGLCMLWD